MLQTGLVISDGMVYIVGGMKADGNPSSMFLEYDVTDDTARCRKLPGLPTSRYATFTFVIGGRLYVVGKLNGQIVYSCITVCMPLCLSELLLEVITCLHHLLPLVLLFSMQLIFIQF